MTSKPPDAPADADLPTKEMLLRHWQNVVRWFVTVDHVLRRRGATEIAPARSPIETSQTLPEPAWDQRRSHSLAEQRSGLSIKRVLAIVLLFGPLYGAAMGSYGFISGDRTLGEQLPQMIFSATKVPLLLLVTVAISLPSFFVVNTLLGLRHDWLKVVGAIVSAQAGLTVVLAAFFPLTVFVYVSVMPHSAAYPMAILFNAAMFGAASIAAQILLRGYYKPLIHREPRHQAMVRVWIFVYAFVGIQAAYVMRPFIGDPSQPTTFFRRDSFQNAYVRLAELLWNIFG